MIRILGWMFLLGLFSSAAPCSPGIAYCKVKAGGAVFHTVTIDLANPNIKVSVALAKGGAGRSESFKSIVKRTHPITAITGTFFDTKTLMPTGDIALFGKIVHRGCIGSALCVDSNNKAAIVSLSNGRKTHWNGYETVLCAGPTLLSNSKIAIALKHEGFRRSLHSLSSRTAVGVTGAGKLLLVAVNRPVSLYSVAKLMLKMGVVDAVCLDGGSSTALFHSARYLAVPTRQLTNLLVVYDSAEEYETARSALAPAELFTADEKPAAPVLTSAFNLDALLPPAVLSLPIPK